MGVFLIFLIVGLIALAIGVFAEIAAKVADKRYKKAHNGYECYGSQDYEYLHSRLGKLGYKIVESSPAIIITWATAIICLGIAILLGSIAIHIQVTTKDTYYKETYCDYVYLTNIIEKDGGEYTLVTLEDVHNYNVKIIKAQHFSDNFWIGWFYNPRIGKELNTIPEIIPREV